MAPPTNRRPGFSRRAQYSLFTGYIVAIVGAGLGAVLLIVTALSPHAFASVRGAASDATSPAAAATAQARGAGQGLFAIVAGYIAAGSQNAQLRHEAEIARVRLAEAAAVSDENRRLKATLALMDEDPRPVAAARLIGSTANSSRRFATLSVGSDRGVAVGMPVRAPLGLIGRVLEVGRRTARVLLITDTESVVPVRRAADGVAAFAQGRADGSVQIRLISLGVNPLKRGDVMVTSGSGGLYRPDIAVAVVASLTRDGAVARVLSDPAASDLVVVDPMWQAPSDVPVPVPTKAKR